jgi:hypothetical protein
MRTVSEILILYYCCSLRGPSALTFPGSKGYTRLPSDARAVHDLVLEVRFCFAAVFLAFSRLVFWRSCLPVLCFLVAFTMSVPSMGSYFDVGACVCFPLLSRSQRPSGTT